VGASAAYPENVQDVAVAVRDVDEGEMAFLAKMDIRTFGIFELLSSGLANIIDSVIEHANRNARGVHVSLDLDVLHQDVAPGVGLRSEYGFDLREATYICRKIACECNVVSIDVVGLNPVRDRNMTTAKHAIQLLLALLGHDFNFGYHDYFKEQTQ